MAREVEHFRDYVRQLENMFPGCGMISIDDAAAYLGRKRRALYNYNDLPKNDGMVSIIALAHWMAVHNKVPNSIRKYELYL